MHWPGGPPSDWDEIRARLRSYNEQLSGRAEDMSAPDFVASVAARPAPSPGRPVSRPPVSRPLVSRGPVSRGPVAPPVRRMPLNAPSAEDVEYGTVFDLPFVRWWQISNPLVMQRAVLVLCVMLAILLILQAF